MYCPKCGQLQIADNTNFCSRCGLPISDVARWLENGEILSVREKTQTLQKPSRRKRNIRRGAKLMFFSGFLLPFFFFFSILVENPVPMLIPIIIFFIGLSFSIYSRLFIENAEPNLIEAPSTNKLSSMFSHKYLPPANALWMKNKGEERLKTAEMVKPPSITEHTTTLLSNDKS